MTQRAYLRDVCLTPKIWFKKTHPDAVLPISNDDSTGTGDSGYDLTAVEDVKKNAKQNEKQNGGSSHKAKQNDKRNTLR